MKIAWNDLPLPKPEFGKVLLIKIEHREEKKKERAGLFVNGFKARYAFPLCVYHAKKESDGTRRVSWVLLNDISMEKPDEFEIITGWILIE